MVGWIGNGEVIDIERIVLRIYVFEGRGDVFFYC